MHAFADELREHGRINGSWKKIIRERWDEFMDSALNKLSPKDGYLVSASTYR